MELDEIKVRVRAIVMEILGGDDQEIKASLELGDDDSLIDGGVIDSISTIRLIESCHTTFDMFISPAELSVENFDSIGRIARLIHGKLNEAEE